MPEPVGDALRTTSIEAAAKVLAPTASNWAAYLPDAERVVDAVLGVAVPSTRRAAHSEAIAAVEAMRTIDRPCPGGGVPYRSIDRCAMLKRLRGLRNTQAPT